MWLLLFDTAQILFSICCVYILDIQWFLEDVLYLQIQNYEIESKSQHFVCISFFWKSCVYKYKTMKLKANHN